MVALSLGDHTRHAVMITAKGEGRTAMLSKRSIGFFISFEEYERYSKYRSFAKQIAYFVVVIRGCSAFECWRIIIHVCGLRQVESDY